MPNKANAAKALRQTKKRAEWNLQRKDAFKNAIKKALKSKTLDEAKKFAKEAQQALGKAAQRGVIKKNTAARRLSRLMAKVNTLGVKK